MTHLNPRGGELLRALQHSLFVEETRMNLTFTPPVIPGPRASRPLMAHEKSGTESRAPGDELFDLHGFPTAAGRAWLAAQPRAAAVPESAERTLLRMSAEIARAVSLGGSVGKRDLERAGFTPAQVETHFDAALTASGVREFE